MLAVGMCFTYMVFCLFSCYRGWILRTVDDHKQFKMAIVLMLWSGFYHFFVIALLWAGHSTRNEVFYIKFFHLHFAIYYVNGFAEYQNHFSHIWITLMELFQGKFTGILLHRAINKCSNPELVGRVVRIIYFSKTLIVHLPLTYSFWHFRNNWTTGFPMLTATYFRSTGLCFIQYNSPYSLHNECNIQTVCNISDCCIYSHLFNNSHTIWCCWIWSRTLQNEQQYDYSRLRKY